MWASSTCMWRTNTRYSCATALPIRWTPPFSAHASSTGPRGSSWRAEVPLTNVGANLLVRPPRLSLPRNHRQPKSLCDALQPFVMGPQCRSRGQPDRSEQMDIDVADAAPKQMVAADEVQDLDIGGDAGLGQIRQGIQDDGA